jgi:hypothetical protein
MVNVDARLLGLGVRQDDVIGRAGRGWTSEASLSLSKSRRLVAILDVEKRRFIYLRKKLLLHLFSGGALSTMRSAIYRSSLKAAVKKNPGAL